MTDLNRLRKTAMALHKVPGTGRMLETLRRRYAGAGERTVDDFDGNIRISLRLSEHMESKIFWYGSYSPSILIALRRLLRPGMTMLDVGANVGEISTVAAKLVGTRGKVYAFEPMPELAARLRHNKELNGFQRIEVIECGLGREPGKFSLYASDHYSGDGMAHSGMMTMFKTKDRAIDTGTVPIMRLDDFVNQRSIERVDAIKIDIEGAELPMLEGAVETLKRDRPMLIVEVNQETARAAGYEPQDILTFLETFNYRFRRLWRGGISLPTSSRKLRPWQNIICLP